MITAHTKSAEDTRDLAGQLAGVARPGDVFLLSGDLGAGKTTFTQGFGRALDVPGPITSPTFTLVQTYEGRLNLVHVDVYRLEHLQEVIDLGLPELLDEGSVALIEWGEAAAPVLAADFLKVRLEYGDGGDGADGADDDRRFVFEPIGRGWVGRADTVIAAVERWAP